MSTDKVTRTKKIVSVDNIPIKLRHRIEKDEERLFQDEKENLFNLCNGNEKLLEDKMYNLFIDYWKGKNGKEKDFSKAEKYLREIPNNEEKEYTVPFLLEVISFYSTNEANSRQINNIYVKIIHIYERKGDADKLDLFARKAVTFNVSLCQKYLKTLSYLDQNKIEKNNLNYYVDDTLRIVNVITDIYIKENKIAKVKVLIKKIISLYYDTFFNKLNRIQTIYKDGLSIIDENATKNIDEKINNLKHNLREAYRQDYNNKLSMDIKEYGYYKVATENIPQGKHDYAVYLASLKNRKADSIRWFIRANESSIVYKTANIYNKKYISLVVAIMEEEKIDKNNFYLKTLRVMQNNFSTLSSLLKWKEYELDSFIKLSALYFLTSFLYAGYRLFKVNKIVFLLIFACGFLTDKPISWYIFPPFMYIYEMYKRYIWYKSYDFWCLVTANGECVHPAFSEGYSIFRTTYLIDAINKKKSKFNYTRAIWVTVLLFIFSISLCNG